MAIITKDTPVRLKVRLNGSKKYKAGTIVAFNRDIDTERGYDIARNMYLFGDPNKVTFSGWSCVYPSNLSILSKSEIDDMSKPQPILARNTTTGATFFYPNVEKASIDIAKKIQVDPTLVFNIYELKGQIKAKEIPVDFVASSLIT